MRKWWLARRDVGPATVLALVWLYAVLWVVARPAGQQTGSYVGQLAGALSVLCMSIALVLISTLPTVEPWFDGIDRAAIWHRRFAIAGLALLVPHLALSSPLPGTQGGGGGGFGAIATIGLGGLAAWSILPRWQSVVPRPVRPLIVALGRLWPKPLRRLVGGYDRWRLVHRTTGIFVALAVVHALLDGTPWADAPVLRWSLVLVGGIGVAAYVYRETVARFFLPLHDYEVAGVQPLSADLTEIALRPLGAPLRFRPGQFAFVFIEAKDGWHRHPFTIASGPDEREVRFTVKGLGDYTRRVPRLIEPGMPAVIGGPHGTFSSSAGTERQVWIAGGVGIAPFLSWLRSEPPDGTRVDLFYSTQGEAPFADEIAEVATRWPSLRVHVRDTDRDGRLTPEQVLAAVDGERADLSVFMCGPAPMLRQFEASFRREGVLRRNVHREYFDWR